MKNPFVPFSLLTVLILLAIPSLSYPFNLTLNNTPTQVYFSPRGGCTEAIISQIDYSKSFSFTSQPIAKALLSAHERGIKVQETFLVGNLPKYGMNKGREEGM